jgi:hypothetical protein
MVCTIPGGWDHLEAMVTSSGILEAFNIATVLDVVRSFKFEVVRRGTVPKVGAHRENSDLVLPKFVAGRC